MDCTELYKYFGLSYEAHQKEREIPSQPFRYSDLPTEIRLRILNFTDLVLPNEDYAVIEEGYFCENERHGFRVNGKRSYRVPSIFGLSKLSKLLNDDVLDVWFSQNRLVLGGDWRENLDFLSSLPDQATRSIRSLVLDIDLDALQGFCNDWSFDVMDWHYFQRFGRADHRNQGTIRARALDMLKGHLPDVPFVELREFCHELSP